MEYKKRLFYQQLWSGECPLEEALETFEKMVVDAGARREELDAAARKALAELDGDQAKVSSDQMYGAIVVSELFRRLDDAEIDDAINLAQKEAMARRISRLLHDDRLDLSRIERHLDRFAALPVGKRQVSASLAIGIRVQLIRTLISDNLFYIGIAKNHITMPDISRLMNCFIGKSGQTSRVGGKSAGMILANSILAPAFGNPTGLESEIAEVESYYLTAELFNRFIEHNRLEEGHGLKYMDEAERERAQAELERRFRDGRFPEDAEGALQTMLDSLGEGPVIVRSSSLLEDSMGFPFYGKYESVFITNQGTRKHRFAELTDAIRAVYQSILASSVIAYRKDKQLLDYDDMMCVLVQRVVGEQHGDYFFPAASGVAFSQNQYRWSRRITPEDGVARIVYGLGTKAVDRSGSDYPRLVALGNPELRPEGTASERLKYSQREVDVLNIKTQQFESIHFVDLYNAIRAANPEFAPSEAISLVGDSAAAGESVSPLDRLVMPQKLEYGKAVIDFRGLIDQGRVPKLLRTVVRRLEDAYGVPVDIEFAWQNGKLHILQCRPLVGGNEENGAVEIPRASGAQRVLFETTRDTFRNAVVEGIRYIVAVDGERYQSLDSNARKIAVARAIGQVNRALEGERFMLIGPGRWGTSNLSLGVRVNYGEINHALVLAEVGSSRSGYTPEVSYGTHFFQDLIEANIVPLALFPDEPGSRYDEAFLGKAENCLDQLPGVECDDLGVCEAIRVVDLDAQGPGRLSIYLSVDEERGVGILG